jgi:mannose-6-phosphate isomerase-like protein (cupin superfamily)
MTDTSQKSIRRIVTGLDENGKATVLYEGPPQSVLFTSNAKVGQLQIDNVPEFTFDVPDGQACFANIWETDGLPAFNMADPLSTPQPFLYEPRGTGMSIRFFRWGPNLDSSTIHATDTLDINYIIAGSVELLLEEGRSVTLRAGDSVIIPGVKHGWITSPEGVTMLNIMQRQAPGQSPDSGH